MSRHRHPPRPLHYDRRAHRLWIAGQRCHHGATGAVLATAGVVGLLGLRVRNPEEVAEVVTGRFAALPGIRRTHTMVAFEVFSQHDLEALFSIGG